MLAIARSDGWMEGCVGGRWCCAFSHKYGFALGSCWESALPDSSPHFYKLPRLQNIKHYRACLAIKIVGFPQGIPITNREELSRAMYSRLPVWASEQKQILNQRWAKITIFDLDLQDHHWWSRSFGWSRSISNWSWSLGDLWSWSWIFKIIFIPNPNK